MTDLNLFDQNKPKDLYEIILEVYSDYSKNPTEKDFLFLAFGFSHLREWIAEGNLGVIEGKKKKEVFLSKGEIFFEEIFELQEFKAIQELCNKRKHFKLRQTKEKPPDTSKEDRPLRAGSRAGDRLNQKFFLIDGKDSREYFLKLIKKYNEWFTRDG